MNSPYPHNAFQIAQARANGMRPAGPLLVSLCNAPNFDNATVYAKPNEAYRWDWVRGLPSVVVLINKETRMGSILDDINRCEPGQLDAVDVERTLGWMVIYTSPKLLTTKWPRNWAHDWLGDQKWHTDLAEFLGARGIEIV